MTKQPANLDLPLAAACRSQRDPPAGEIDNQERFSIVTEPRPNGQGYGQRVHAAPP
jgi:hypothetical protein